MRYFDAGVNHALPNLRLWVSTGSFLRLIIVVCGTGCTKPGQSEESLASKDPLVSEEQQDDLNQPCLYDPLSPVGGPLDLKEPSASEPESPGREPVTKDPSSTTPKTSGKGLDTKLHLSDTVVISERYCFSCNAKNGTSMSAATVSSITASAPWPDAGAK